MKACRKTRTILFAVLFISTTPAVQAATNTWNCTNDYWYNSSCWSLLGIPTSTDDVVVGPVSSSNTLSTFDATTGTQSVNLLTINSTTANTITLNQTGGSLKTNTYEYIGRSGTGTFTQSGGTNTATFGLILGNDTGSNGTYNLSAGSLSALSEIVGFRGTGTFTQSGGTNTVTGDLSLAYWSGSNGTYNLSAGSLSVARNEYVGTPGNGTFNQSGGTHTVTNDLYIGRNFGSNGTFNQSGGTTTVAGDLYLGGGGSGSTGTYNLSGTGSLSAGTEYIGSSGTGTFNQNGGTHIATSLILGWGSNSTYNLDGGTLTVSNGITNNPTNTFNVGNGAVATVGGPGFVNHGLLKGEGTIVGNVTSEGTVAPGNSPGKLSITGNYTQLIPTYYPHPDVVLDMEIGGLLAGTEYDVLNISGTASLSGKLNVSLFDLGSGLFTPHLGDTFDLLTAQTITGNFNSLSFAALLDPDLAWHLDYLTDAIGTTDVVRLSVVASAVPVPAAVWLFGSGLLGLIGVARRKPQQHARN